MTPRRAMQINKLQLQSSTTMNLKTNMRLKEMSPRKAHTMFSVKASLETIQTEQLQV